MSTIDLNSLLSGNVTIKPTEPPEDAALRRRKEWWTFVLLWGVVIVMGLFLVTLIYIKPTQSMADQALNALIGLFTGGISYLVGQKTK